ncbi:terminase small subunit [Planococcus sp. A6]|uniref:terminase small subunit n=1 Tax=Planococcus sp. A6 TaxID=2992760 RepID=UPI00237AAEA3|nr:terminase small subunit [Planococcus sp. A6]MDE0582227.1 terminase small subunit [Planococcus sp. A6]
MVKLTVKQQRFADEYILTGNATQAAILAGYSEKTARSIGQENLTKPVIRTYIENRLEELRSEKVADQQEVMETLTRILRRESKEMETVVVKRAATIDYTLANGETAEKVVYNEYAQTIELDTRNSDVNRAAELIGKRHAMWTDKAEITQRVIEINVGDYDDDD